MDVHMNYNSAYRYLYTVQYTVLVQYVTHYFNESLHNVIMPYNINLKSINKLNMCSLLFDLSENGQK